MADRPDFTPEKPFTAEQLSEIRRKFALLSTPSLQTAYTGALERCRLGRDGRPPNAEHIQTVVLVLAVEEGAAELPTLGEFHSKVR
jgi:hypothetical protein